MVTDVKKGCSARILRVKKKKKEEEKRYIIRVKKIRVASRPNRPSSLASVKL